MPGLSTNIHDRKYKFAYRIDCRISYWCFCRDLSTLYPDVCTYFGKSRRLCRFLTEGPNRFAPNTVLHKWQSRLQLLYDWLKLNSKIWVRLDFEYLVRWQINIQHLRNGTAPRGHFRQQKSRNNCRNSWINTEIKNF